MKIEVLGRYSFANYKLASKIDVHNVIHKPRLSHPHRISRHYLRTSDDRLIIFDKIIYKVIRALAPPSILQSSSMCKISSIGAPCRIRNGKIDEKP